ncbi:MAG: retron St85 family effector protein [Desulfobulbaceae bacterium]|nr:retron St85 family effector protein [Desulfobulbaceae bacterium]
MEVADPREFYLSLISLEKSYVKLSPPIVFLFGGAIPDIGVPPQSVRGRLYDYIFSKHSSLSQSLVIPEDFKDWLHDSIYPDLLSFESDLAQTSSLVIIALESPGAIAELGSFSVNCALKDKMIIIISEHHHNQDSFITLGPLRQLPKKNVYSYPYDHMHLGRSLDDFLEDIVENIKTNLEGLDKTERFDTKNNGHVSLLIYELLLLFKALKLVEIQGYLKTLSINISLTVIKRLLFLLEKLELVRKKRLGNIDYYVPARTDQRINFSSVDKSKLFDRNSAIIGTAGYYASSRKEKMRKRVIGGC